MSQESTIEPDEVIELPAGRLERRGNAVDWRGEDGRLTALGRVEEPDGILAALAAIEAGKPPLGLLEWCWSRG